MTTARYALRSPADSSFPNTWSVGGVWSGDVPAVADLLTGPEVDAFAKRHPRATIVDVIVYRARAAVWIAAFRAATVPNSTHEQRQAARAAGNAALVAAGYPL